MIKTYGFYKIKVWKPPETFSSHVKLPPAALLTIPVPCFHSFLPVLVLTEVCVLQHSTVTLYVSISLPSSISFCWVFFPLCHFGHSTGDHSYSILLVSGSFHVIPQSPHNICKQIAGHLRGHGAELNCNDHHAGFRVW